MLPQAVVDPAGVVGPDGALHHSHLPKHRSEYEPDLNKEVDPKMYQVVDAVITDLFHETKNTSTEEDLGVAVSV